MRLVVSPMFARGSQSPGNIYNIETGENFSITEEAMKLLKMFKDPAEADDVIASLGLNQSETAIVCRFIKRFRQDGILVPCDKPSAVNVKQPLVCATNPTFFGSPRFELGKREIADFVFIGAPFDLGTTGYPGARFGPDKMRSLSAELFIHRADIFSGKSKGWFCADSSRIVLEGVRIGDAGNVALVLGEDFERFHERLYEVVRRVIRRSACPIVIGGDHSCSYGPIRALSRVHKELGLIHVDAHTDLAELKPGLSHHHGNVFTRVMNERLVRQMYQFGIRGFAGANHANDHCVVFPSAQITAENLSSFVNRIDQSHAYYLSVDIDAIDPSFAPGTGTPVSLGMMPAVLSQLLSLIARHIRLVGIDLVEVNPMLDSNDITTRLANSLISQLLIDLSDGRGKL